MIRTPAATETAHRHAAFPHAALATDRAAWIAATDDRARRAPAGELVMNVFMAFRFGLDGLATPE